MEITGLCRASMSEGEAMELSPASLAYIGDTVYDLYIRAYVVHNRHRRISEMHRLSVSAVNAASQAKIAELLLPVLTERELYVLKRGRNAKTGSTPKHMDVVDYRWATGVETLTGYLYLTGKFERLDELFEIILRHFFEIVSEAENGEN